MSVRCILGILATLALMNSGQARGADKPKAPTGVRVWPAGALQTIAADAKPPQGTAEAGVELASPRNGFASGQVVIWAPEAFNGPQCAMSDLRSADGGLIPAAGARVRYADAHSGFVPLHEQPRSGKQVQPVWVTLHAGAEAKPGAYKGTLTLDWADRPAAVPVTLNVFGWKVPDLRRQRAAVNLLQSPESLACYYEVPLWSDRHFALIRKSFELMAYLGNNIFGVSAVGKGVFGNDPVLMFRKVNGRLVPDYKLLERYLQLYVEQAGAPHFFCVNVWNYSMCTRGEIGRGRPMTLADEVETIPIAEIQGDKIVETMIPMHGRPGTEEIWKGVFDTLPAVLEKYGVPKERILLGTTGDMWPSDHTVKFFQKVAPYGQWRTLSHGQGAPRWSYTDEGRTQPNGMITGYYEGARLLPNNRPRVRGRPLTCNARDNVGWGPTTFRGLAGILIFREGYDGVCWKGLDYYPYMTAEGTKRSALASYSRFGNMVGGTPRAISAPGPDGPLATQQIEMMREGLQEVEAMHAMREALDTLFPPPLKLCDVIELNLTRGVCRPSAAEPNPPGTDLVLTLYFHDGGIGISPQARGYNLHRREGAAKIVKPGNPQTVQADIILDRDSAGKDCTGSYTIELTRQGNKFRGTYVGRYRGAERKGDVGGSFHEKAYPFKTGEPPPKTELQQRAEEAQKALQKFWETGDGGAQYAKSSAQFYALLTEIAERAAARK